MGRAAQLHPGSQPGDRLGGGERGFFWMVGQGGYGIQTAPAAGRLLASLVNGAAPDPDVAAAVPLCDPRRFERSPRMRPRSFAEVAAAAGRLRGKVVRTPLLRHRLLDERTGGNILVKPEPLQKTGSFKLRGATNAALLLEHAARRAGVVTHSSGNHGQALACAARMLGMPALIAMPSDAPAIKVESTRRWGAEIHPFDRHGVDRDALAAGLAAERGATVIPPFDHPHVIAGQGTVALELIEDARARASRSTRWWSAPAAAG